MSLLTKTIFKLTIAFAIYFNENIRTKARQKVMFGAKMTPCICNPILFLEFLLKGEFLS